MNFIADQSCNHTVFIFNKYAEKSEKLKNLYLNLLYIYYNFFIIYNNYLILIIFTSLNLSFLNSC